MEEPTVPRRCLFVMHAMRSSARISISSSSALGAGAGVALAHRVAYLAFLTPAAIIGIVTVTSFLPSTARVDSLAEAE